jgi:hypothetical protein
MAATYSFDASERDDVAVDFTIDCHSVYPMSPLRNLNKRAEVVAEYRPRRNKMKVRSLILTGVLGLLTLPGFAADESKATITLSQPATIGSTQLAPGQYKMTWNGTGSDVQVRLSQGKKAVATVPARVVEQRSGLSSPAVLTDSKTGALLGVQLPEQSLTFNGEKPGAGN